MSLNKGGSLPRHVGLSTSSGSSTPADNRSPTSTLEKIRQQRVGNSAPRPESSDTSSLGSPHLTHRSGSVLGQQAFVATVAGSSSSLHKLTGATTTASGTDGGVNVGTGSSVSRGNSGNTPSTPVTPVLQMPRGSGVVPHGVGANPSGVSPTFANAVFIDIDDAFPATAHQQHRQQQQQQQQQSAGHSVLNTPYSLPAPGSPVVGGPMQQQQQQHQQGGVLPLSAANLALLSASATAVVNQVHANNTVASPLLSTSTQNRWYAPTFTAPMAEAVLANAPTGAFLVRASLSRPGTYALALKYNSSIEHISITKNAVGRSVFCFVYFLFYLFFFIIIIIIFYVCMRAFFMFCVFLHVPLLNFHRRVTSI